jgi:formylglycine-generating enzyme required for sulfatase activity
MDDPCPDYARKLFEMKGPHTMDRKCSTAIFVRVAFVFLVLVVWSHASRGGPATGADEAGGVPGYSAEALDRDMVRVPGGEFLYGMTREEKKRAAGNAGVHPDMLRDHSDRRTLTVPEFLIDRYPVTRGQFARFMKATGYGIMTNGWVVGWRDLTESWPPDRPGMEALPMIGVNADDAEAYARWAGKRLPTEAEWELAARGTNGWLFPWGNEPSTNACYEGAGNVAFSSSFPVGSWPAGGSPYGVQDMVGLVCQYVRATGGAQTHMLAGSSVFHTQVYSRMVTARFGWCPTMRNYVSGFRCASATPPTGGVARAAYQPGPGKLPAKLAIRRDLYNKAPITLRGTETTTLEMHVPWFPESIWLIDLPEATVGPFPGANHWPEPGTAVTWKETPDGQCASYVREKGTQRVALEAWVDGNSVRFAFDCHNVSVTMYDVCMKTISPFFSSQERMVQGVVRDGNWLRVADMPVGFKPWRSVPLRVEDRTPFFWAVDDAVPLGNHAILRSFDGTAFVARVGSVQCQPWGNSSIPCTHLAPLLSQAEQGGRVIFFVGSQEELAKEIQQ